MSRDYSLKTTFNTVADIYDRARPIYPDILFDTLVEEADITRESNILEIGCGTGQATRYFAQNNLNVLAIDIGGNLLEVAKNNFQNNENITLKNTSFEDLEIEDGSLDLIYSATAFHWVDPDLRFTKTHKVLEENGYLAIIDTKHVSDEQGDAFFNATQKWYKKYQTEEEYDPNFTLPKKTNLRPKSFDENLFELVNYKLFPVTEEYTADRYVDLLQTYSNHISMSDNDREGFMEAIKETINKEFDGTIQKHFVFTLTLLEALK